jgi:iron complex transport system permease protein
MFILIYGCLQLPERRGTLNDLIKKNLSTFVLAAVLLVLSVWSLFIGVLNLDISGIFKGDVKQIELLLISRLPRLLAIICTGVGMSVAGLIMQQLCMNKFVSPTTGATISSAQFGILIALLFMPSSTLWSRALFAFATAIIGTWVFIGFIQRIRFKDPIMVPLVGVMFGNIINGITSFLAYKYNMTQALSSWLVGHFSMVLRGRYEIVYLVVPLVILAFVYANHFNIVGMGRDFSENLGVNYNLVLFMGLTIASMITASVVVVVGAISYIGLIVPNLVAMFKGDKIRGTLIDMALFGAIFVLVCDMLARVLIAPYELPIELIIGIAGSVVYIVLLFYRLKHGRKAIKLWKAKNVEGREGGKKCETTSFKSVGEPSFRR